MVIWEGIQLTKLVPIDDDVLKSDAVGIDYVAINAPNIVIPCKHKDKELLVEIGVLGDWEVKREELIQKSTEYLEDVITESTKLDEVISRLEKFVAKRIYLDNAEIILKIVERLERSEGKSSVAKEALTLAEIHSKELFVDGYGRPFAAIKVNDGEHVEIHSMEESAFRHWLSGLYFKEKKEVLGDADIDKVIRILVGRAHFERDIKKYRLDLRVRGYNSDIVGINDVDNENGSGDELFQKHQRYEDSENFTEIYYDLTNRNWEAVKIAPTGWEIVREPPILFRRYGTEEPQVYPSKEYSTDILDQYIRLQNIRNENEKFLKKVWLIACFWPNTTPKPILLVDAPQGSAKTTMSDMDRDLVDPNTSKTSSIPKEDLNLKLHLAQNYMASFDNVSYINDEQSDTFCRAVTGGRDTKRKLFTDSESITFSYKRVITFNGIVNAATRPDLLDRGFKIGLGSISAEDRDLIKSIRDKFETIRSQVLGFTLDVISEVLAHRQRTKHIDPYYFDLKQVVKDNGGVPRMADYAILGEQIAAVIARKEDKPYTPGDFLRAWNTNYETLNVEALKSSLLAEALVSFMTERQTQKLEPWEGTASKLLGALNYFINQHNEIVIDIHSHAWPNNPKRLGRELARISENLKQIGITVESYKTNSNMVYVITGSAKLLKETPLIPQIPQNPESSTDKGKSIKDGSGISGISGAEKPEETTLIPQTTLETTLPEAQNERERGDSGISGISGIKNDNSQGLLNEGLVYTMIKIAMRDEESGTASNKDYFLGKVFVRHLMTQPATKMTEDEAEQTLQALVDDGTIEGLGDDQYRPVQMQKVQELNWW